MYKATIEGLIDINIPKKKYWYVDYKQYNYMNDIALGCYEDQDEYDIQIKDIHDSCDVTYFIDIYYLGEIRWQILKALKSVSKSQRLKQKEIKFKSLK